jgi:hypothetical protein
MIYLLPNSHRNVCAVTFTQLLLRYVTVATLGGLVVGVLAVGPKIHVFRPDRGRWIFKGDKNPYHDILWRGSKAVGPMS